MTTQSKTTANQPKQKLSQGTRRKLSLLQLAEELGNVSKACKIMGYHRDTFYEVKRAFQNGGVAGLVEKKRGARSPHPNRLPEEVENKVLDYVCIPTESITHSGDADHLFRTMPITDRSVATLVV